MLLYQLWDAIQDGEAQTTPGKAIGFMFIPAFNLYWNFVSVWGLSQDLNKYTRRHNLACPTANEPLALAWCILCCCCVIPYVGILTAIAATIILVIVMKKMCDTAVAIIQQTPNA